MADSSILVGGAGENYAEPRELLLRYANRHGLIAGATGTGKTVTLQILAEGLSAAGVPVFVQDAKGDISGLSRPGDPNGKMDAALRARAQIGFADFAYRAFPVVFWDLFGAEGHQIRATITEMGLLLSRILELSDAQEGVLNIAFKVADEQGLALLDLADLKAMLTWLSDNASEVGRAYGNIAPASIGAIQRALLVLENQGATNFFGEPRLQLKDLMVVDAEGMGQVNVLMADKLMRSPRLYATFLLWLLSELFEELPEIGDPDKPVMVFFFDEAHLLFDGAPKALVDKVTQVVRLIRSKGVGVYFITQNPDDVPEAVLGQLGNRVQHALRAFTPRDQKALRLAAQTFRPNPEFDTETAIREVGTGEAVISLLEEKGVPAMVSRALIRPPQSRLGPITAAERAETMAASPVAGRYDTTLDPESAAEILARRADEAGKAAAKQDATELAERMLREAGTKKPAAAAPRARATRVEPSLVAEIARTVVKQLGSRQGQQLVRGILGGLFRAK